MLESELLSPVARHFEARGFRAISEVAVAGRRADLVAISDDDLVAVELKIADWPHALRQAIAYQVWAPSAYVALPFPRAFRAGRDGFEAAGVGLLGILDGAVRTFVAATPSPRLFPALSDLVRRQLARPARPLDAFGVETRERFYGASRM